MTVLAWCRGYLFEDAMHTARVGCRLTECSFELSSILVIIVYNTVCFRSFLVRKAVEELCWLG